ncbi:MAG: glycosyltransferase family 2 protein [Cyclobacteriaceae bacterium]
MNRKEAIKSFTGGLSVIIPTYNRESSIRLAIKSVIDDINELGEWEIIVVDDCSSDKTVSMIQDMDVVIVQMDKNQGANWARNIGVERAKNEWIAFHDSDDVWLPGKFELFSAKFEGVDFLFTSLVQFDSNSAGLFPFKKNPDKLEDNFFKSRILRKNYVSTQTLFAKKSVLKSVGLFDTEMPRFQDWELAIRLFQSFEGRFIKNPGSIAYINGDSITKNYMNGIVGRKLILKKHLQLYLKNPLAMFYFILNLFLRYIFLPIKK